LGFDCSAVAASCAVIDCESGKVIAQGSVNTKITHSQSLMPLTESVLKAAGLTFADIDAFAVSKGPGSFTGLRIGVSVVKGLAYSLSKPVCGVSTLLAHAHNLIELDCTACAVMDARRGEFYNALFRIQGAQITRLTPDRAITAEDLAKELKHHDNVILIGDGAELAHHVLTTVNSQSDWQLSTVNCQAVGVCFAAVSENAESEFTTAAALMPVYIRRPQAEREAEERKQTS